MSLLLTLLRAGPITWTRWSDAIAAATDTRPRLVLVGDALDHWSSAMVAALNADVALGAALAEVFVCVAVDAAAEPVVAAQLQQALQLSTGASGLPLIAICTPTSEPFGATPWRRAHDLAHVLLQAAEAWHQRPADCVADAQRIAAAARMLRTNAPESSKPLRATLVLEAAESAAIEAADTIEGGFGPAPRTAEPALWGLLVARAARSEAPLSLIKQLEHSLAAVAAGAAHDHLAGGFFHGCDDAAWRIPRCAKRLTDQTHLALLLLDAAAAFSRPLWHELALRTLAFAVDSLRLPDGSFAHGLHADSPAGPGRWEAGAVYRWSTTQVAEVVGNDGARLIAQRFGLPADDHESGYLAVGAALTASEQARVPALIQRLRIARDERPQPRRDESVYPHEQAQMAYACECAGLSDFAEGLARHLTGADPWTGRALVARWHRTGTPEPRALAIAAGDLDDDVDPAGGLAPTAVLGHLRLDLAALTGDPAWRVRALELVERARDRVRAAPLACAGLLSVLERASANEVSLPRREIGGQNNAIG